jgi:hypothetical protein
MGLRSLGDWALGRARSKLEQRGLWGTVKWSLGQLLEVPSRHLRRGRGKRREREYDRLHGVETSGIISPARLTHDSAMAVNAYAYQGVDPWAACAVLERLPIDFKQYAFVDLGSGKGRFLMCARPFGFRNLTGVEFSPKLCAIARRNHARLKSRDPLYPDWDIICADAGTYEFSGPTVLCMFNPFGPEVMRRVLARVKPDTCTYVVYFNPKHADLWEQQGSFRLVYTENECRVYAHCACA